MPDFFRYAFMICGLMISVVFIFFTICFGLELLRDGTESKRDKGEEQKRHKERWDKIHGIVKEMQERADQMNKENSRQVIN